MLRRRIRHVPPLRGAILLALLIGCGQRDCFLTHDFSGCTVPDESPLPPFTCPETLDELPTFCDTALVCVFKMDDGSEVRCDCGGQRVEFECVDITNDLSINEPADLAHGPLDLANDDLGEED
jgi:hypothetical protein